MRKDVRKMQEMEVKIMTEIICDGDQFPENYQLGLRRESRSGLFTLYALLNQGHAFPETVIIQTGLSCDTESVLAEIIAEAIIIDDPIYDRIDERHRRSKRRKDTIRISSREYIPEDRNVTGRKTKMLKTNKALRKEIKAVKDFDPETMKRESEEDKYIKQYFNKCNAKATTKWKSSKRKKNAFNKKCGEEQINEYFAGNNAAA